MKTTTCTLVFACLSGAVLWAQDPLPRIDQETARVTPAITGIRHRLHQFPELSNREEKTAALVADYLRKLGLEVQTGVAKHGVVALLKGALPGPVVAVRADMDALPVTEETSLPFASKLRATYQGQDVGVMHACGHDIHTAVQLGVASVLTSMKATLPGTVKFIFQPAEEGPPPGEEGGASLMVKEGVLQNPRPQAIFGLHAFSEMEVGQIGYSEGPALSAADTWEVKIVGRQSHGARPELSIDPIVVAAQFVQALQTIRSRTFSGHEPGVVTVGTIHGGTRHNIIPADVTLTGTIRTFRPEMSTLAEARLRAILKGVTEAAGATGEVVRYERGAPATMNHDQLTRESVPSLERAAGKVTRIPPAMGSEDFSFFERSSRVLLPPRSGEAWDDDRRSPHADVPGGRCVDSRGRQDDESARRGLPAEKAVDAGQGSPVAEIALMRMCLAGLALLLAQAAAPAPPRFEQVQSQLFSAGGTLVNAAADYDGDGDDDLFVGFNGAANRLYRNDAGVFADVAAAAGVADARPTRAAAWGDFDADGDPDLLVGFAPATPAASVLRLYRNDRGRFTDVANDAGLAVNTGAVRQPVWVDADADGDLDLFVGFRDRADMFFRNASGRFTDLAGAIGLADSRKTVGAVWFDYDEDGDLDLYAAHMDGDANGLYRNDKGRFTDVAERAGLAWGGRAPADASNGTVRPCAADVNGDGRFDLFMANYGKNGLFLNRGGGVFEDVSAAWGIAIDGRYDTCAFGDLDNDGRLDLYVNGTVTGGKTYRDYLFRNTGQRFEDITPSNVQWLDADHGALWMDFDRDGDVDLALTGAQPFGMHLLMRNALARAAARSIHVRVTDARDRSLRAGAEIRAYAAGTRRLLAARLVDSGSSYDAQSDIPQHLGLGAHDRVDVEVIWPASGARRVTRVANLTPASAPITIKAR